MSSNPTFETLDALHAAAVTCRACPRLVAWREEVAATKRQAFRDRTYWGKPVPGWGDPRARLLVLGLAPARMGPIARAAHLPETVRAISSIRRCTGPVSPADRPAHTGATAWSLSTAT